jgi:hypothetical protein
MTATVLAIITSVITLIFIVDLLRRGVLKEKYAVLWLTVASLALILSIFPGILRWITQALGVEVPSNLLFFATIVLLILVAVQLSYELSRHEARIRRLAEEVALQNEQIRSLRDRLDARDANE